MGRTRTTRDTRTVSHRTTLTPLPQVGPKIKVDDIPLAEGAEQIAVFRLPDGTLRALGAPCPHRGDPLADGLLDDKVVVCPLHGYTYDLETGAEVSTGGSAVCAYTVSIDQQQEMSVQTNQPSRTE